MTNDLMLLSGQLSQVVTSVSSAVVSVHGRPRIPSSGFAWGATLIVTSDHALVSRDDRVEVTLPNGDRVPAAVRGRDGASDVALLEVPGADLKPVERAGVPELRPGAILLAVGRNADTGPTASMGILSAAGGAWRTWRGGQMERFLRLDLSLFPGSAGGAVVDAEGRLVGLASDALSRLSPLAVPVETVARVVAELESRGHVRRAFLGVGTHPVEAGGRKGLILLSVDGGSAADRAGLLVGDVLLSLGGESTEEPEALQDHLARLDPGHETTVRIIRGGEIIDVSVQLGERSGGRG
jgi:S1-C subfamily serine protease